MEATTSWTLYVINLSDNSDPFVEGELEITGFSSYLHPINDNLLLGIGQAATDTGVTTGLKLTLFDTSEAANPTEISSTELGGRGSWAEILYDHKAISFLDLTETNTEETSTLRMAFTWSHYSEDGYDDWLGDAVYVADIDTSNNTFTEQLNSYFDHPDDSNYWYSYGYTRAALHSDGLHLVLNGEVTSGDVDSWQGGVINDQ